MTPAVDALKRERIAHRVVVFENHARRDYGQEAAAALEVDADLVYKTLVAKLDDSQLVLALIPVDRALDLKTLAAISGAKRARMAPVADAERATGYLSGGISPIGTKRRLRTFIDTSMSDLQRVYVSGGRRGLEIELWPADLIAITGATVAQLAH